MKCTWTPCWAKLFSCMLIDTRHVPRWSLKRSPSAQLKHCQHFTLWDFTCLHCRCPHSYRLFPTLSWPATGAGGAGAWLQVLEEENFVSSTFSTSPPYTVCAGAWVLVLEEKNFMSLPSPPYTGQQCVLDTESPPVGSQMWLSYLTSWSKRAGCRSCHARGRV